MLRTATNFSNGTDRVSAHSLGHLHKLSGHLWCQGLSPKRGSPVACGDAWLLQLAKQQHIDTATRGHNYSIQGNWQCTNIGHNSQTLYPCDWRFRFCLSLLKCCIPGCGGPYMGGGGHTPTHTVGRWLALWDCPQISFLSRSFNNTTCAWLRMIWNII